MASGHMNRIKRPNTWLQRPMLQNREESSCQTGAVHTWHIASFRCDAELGRYRCIADMVPCRTNLIQAAEAADPQRGKVQRPFFNGIT